MADTSAERYLALKTTMMPRDTNPHGTIFGGVILSYIDLAGANGARHAIRAAGWPAQLIVTVAMDRVEFHEPVHVGDMVSFFTHVERVGTTSLTMHVEVETERDNQIVKVTEAAITFVAVKSLEGRRTPTPIRGE